MRLVASDCRLWCLAGRLRCLPPVLKITSTPHTSDRRNTLAHHYGRERRHRSPLIERPLRAADRFDAGIVRRFSLSRAGDVTCRAGAPLRRLLISNRRRAAMAPHQHRAPSVSSPREDGRGDEDPRLRTIPRIPALYVSSPTTCRGESVPQIDLLTIIGALGILITSLPQ